MIKLIVILSATLVSVGAFADCQKVDKGGAKSAYAGEDLAAIGYTYDTKAKEALVGKFGKDILKGVLTGAFVPCSGDSCKGKNYVTCE